MTKSLPRVYSIDGIVLKRRNTGEADRILTVFTRKYGKMRIVAKGIRRAKSKRAGHVEVFECIRATIHRGHGLDVMGEVVQAEGIAHLSLMHQIMVGYYLCELIDKLLADEQEHAEVYDLLSQALRVLSQSKTPEKSMLISYRFALRLLELLGFLPTARKLSEQEINPYIEGVAERKLRTWHLLTKVIDPS